MAPLGGHLGVQAGGGLDEFPDGGEETAVGRTPDRSRASRGNPVSFSRAFIIWVNPDCVIPSFAAARVNVPDSAA